MPALDHLHLSPQGFLFDHNSGLIYTVNGVGAFLLGRLIAGGEPRALTGELLEHYEVDETRAARDVDEFLDLLRRHNLLPRSGEDL
jgi:hypothetical protein